MTITEILSSPSFKALGWSLLHSLWQAIVIYLLAWLIMKSNPNGSAKWKYNLSYCSLMVIVIWFISTLDKQLEIQLNYANNSQLRFQAINAYDTIQYTQLSPQIGWRIFENSMPFIMMIYLVGLLLFSLKMIIDGYQILFLRTNGLSSMENIWEKKINEIAVKLHLHQRIDLFLSEYINVPLMIGYFKPIILLPLSILMSLQPAQIEAILIHEMSHIKRRDYLFNMLQSFIETLFFFNPCVWLLSKIIREEREKACDEIVIQHTSAFSYATALLALEETKQSQILALAAIGKKPQLLNRIKNITMKENYYVGIKHKAISVLIVLLGIVSIAWLSPMANNKLAQAKNGHVVTTNTENTETNSYQLQISSTNNTNNTGKQFIKKNGLIPAQNVNFVHYADSSIPDTSHEHLQKLKKEIKNEASKMNFFDLAAEPEFKKQMDAIKIQARNLSDSKINSEEWKEKAELIKLQAEKIKTLMLDNPQWKKQMENIKLQAEKIKESTVNSAEWQTQMKRINEQAGNMALAITENPQWKKQLQSITKQAQELNDKTVNSVEWKKQIEKISKQAGKMSQNLINSKEWKDQMEMLQKKLGELNKNLPALDKLQDSEKTNNN